MNDLAACNLCREHSSMSLESVANNIRAAQAAMAPPVVRVPGDGPGRPNQKVTPSKRYACFQSLTTAKAHTQTIPGNHAGARPWRFSRHRSWRPLAKASFPAPSTLSSAIADPRPCDATCAFVLNPSSISLAIYPWCRAAMSTWRCVRAGFRTHALKLLKKDPAEYEGPTLSCGRGSMDWSPPLNITKEAMRRPSSFL